MKGKTKLIKPGKRIVTSDIDAFDSLADFALDMRCQWNHSADEIWQQLEPDLWNSTHNPWVVLQTVSRDRFEEIMSDPVFHEKVDALIKSNTDAISGPAWFQKTYPESSLTKVAYFSMEFMLSESLPIYSGGLGNVAGDQLKASSDLGVPVVGIGLLYQQGYFRQEIDQNGEQQALYPYNDPGQLPVVPLRDANGEWLRLKIELPGYSVWLRTWLVQVGRIKLYLLDSNDAANFPIHRGITSELYGGGPELRLKQEMVLGIGGWRLLMALGIHPEVCHLNEGHAAFAILERAADFMKKTGLSFNSAMVTTRPGNIFTTHTAVAAGFDLFQPNLIDLYMGEYAEKKLGISRQQLLALGRVDAMNPAEKFNMAYLAIRGSGAVNGVSLLHGEVSRHIFEPLFPKWPASEVPVGSITNGVHMPTWDSKEADDIWTQYCGKDRWLGMNTSLEKDMLRVSDEELWALRTKANKSLIVFAREYFSRQLDGSGHSPETIERAKHLFDPEVLTIGFARRFATYKRPNLLLHDPQRLMSLLTNPEYPVQLIISGKAHPADQEGKNLIKEWILFIRKNGVHPPVIFLSDYNMLISENLVCGVDVWINTPRRPWEASGTSGMKVLVNGGINLSELDGWWAEAYTPEAGWALGDGKEHGDDPAIDAIEAEQLYNILEQQVVPEFYKRNEKGIPVRWIARMRESMARLTPRFSADRTVKEYTEQRYLPAAKEFLERAAENGKIGKLITEKLENLNQNWYSLHFGEMKVTAAGNNHKFKVQVFFGDIDPDLVQVELFASGENDSKPEIIKMKREIKTEGSSKTFSFNASVSSERTASDYTPRAIASIGGVSLPLESNLITWHH
jgi:starch phosphorylase